MFRAFTGLVRKEFIQVFRDPNMLRMIFAIPIVQLLLFGYVVNTEVKKLDVDVYDFDQTEISRQFSQTIGVDNYFTPHQPAEPILSLDERFLRSETEMALVIPPDFGDDLGSGKRATIGIVADGSNANRTAIGMGYMARMARAFSTRQTGLSAPIDVKYRSLYNPEMESVFFMVPGIVAALLTMVTIMLTAMAIVRERERGTLEQLLVTPMSGRTLLMGKLFPFAVLGMIEISVALAFGVLWFQVPFAGSVLLLFILSILYLFATLGIGLLFSTLTSTQQQAMFFAWFFSVFALLTSGFFTPIANMPQWVQYVTYINPMRYYMSIVRGIMMRGSSLADLSFDSWALLVFGVTVFSIASLRFSKRVS